MQSPATPITASSRRRAAVLRPAPSLGAVEPLPAPSAMQREVPIGGTAAEIVARGRDAIRAVLHGEDARLFVVVGPCSIHDRAQALEYAQRLAALKVKTRGELLIVMRTYFEKPRTTVGWKGLLNDPGLDGSFEIVRGLRLARQVLGEINAMGLPCGTELLDPLAARYLEDGIAWAAIGARTSASQIHREAASGWPMPVGLKNDVAGDIAIATQAVEAVRQPHHFVGVDREGIPAVLHSEGNPDAHVILRGGSPGTNRPGASPSGTNSSGTNSLGTDSPGTNSLGTNYDSASVASALALLPLDAPRRSLVIDCSHGNSQKQHERQAAVLRDVRSQIAAGQQRIAGVMLESFLKPGQQSWKPGGPLRHGVSITDACLGWEQTEALLLETAEIWTTLPKGAV